MDLSSPWPVSNGEWMAFASASVTVLLGLMLLFAPLIAFRLYRIQPVDAHPNGVATGRASMAGFLLGLGLSCLLLAQPLIYLALGFSWAFAAFGRLVSILSDRGATPGNLAWLAAELVLAGMALVFALGLVR